uniref:Uncharacterized protein n=1 Tax=Arion vulgaris TaxID=1028688 RepID=A0A0B6ZB49_9EUPU
MQTQPVGVETSCQHCVVYENVIATSSTFTSTVLKEHIEDVPIRTQSMDADQQQSDKGEELIV